MAIYKHLGPGSWSHYPPLSFVLATGRQEPQDFPLPLPSRPAYPDGRHPLRYLRLVLERVETSLQRLKDTLWGILSINASREFSFILDISKVYVLILAMGQ